MRMPVAVAGLVVLSCGLLSGDKSKANEPPILVLKTNPVADYSTDPYPTISGPRPLTVLFNLCQSDDPDMIHRPDGTTGGDSLNWQFNFGDIGRGSKPAFNPDGTFNPDFDQFCRVEYTYNVEGCYVATVSVTDKHLEDQDRGVTALARTSRSLTIKAGVSSCAITPPVGCTGPTPNTLYGAQSGLSNAGPHTGGFYRINAATGAGTLIGTLAVGIGAMKFHPLTNELYGVSSPGFIPPSGTTRELYRIDPCTGAMSLVGPLGATGFKFGIADIAFTPAGILYGWSENSDDIVTINLGTGAATVIANAGISTFGSGMDFGANGTLYLAGGGGNGNFYSVNPATGLPTLLGTLTGSPFPGFPIPAMALGPGGVMYAVNRTFPPAATGSLVTINTTTRVTTVIGPTVPRLDGMAWSH